MKKPENLAARMLALEFVDLARADDATRAAMRRTRNLPQIRDYLVTSHEIGEEEHRKWLQGLGQSDRILVFAVRDGERIVGQASLTSLDRANGHAEWGFYVDPAVQGRGAGLAMLARMLDLAFGEMKLNRIAARVLDYNAASLSLHRRLGFVEAGRLPRYKEHNGEFRDCLLLAITAGEWKKARKALLEKGN